LYQFASLAVLALSGSSRRPTLSRWCPVMATGLTDFLNSAEFAADDADMRCGAPAPALKLRTPYAARGLVTRSVTATLTMAANDPVSLRKDEQP